MTTEEQRERHREWSKQYRANMTPEQREKVRASARAYQQRHRDKLLPVMREYSRERYAADRRLALFEGAKRRARLEGLPFTITIDDIVIPETCPVLSIPIILGQPANDPHLPSLDKFDPALGYTPDNITVMSLRANSIKKNATVEEVQALLNWMINRKSS